MGKKSVCLCFKWVLIRHLVLLGYLHLFFQKNWDIVGDSVCRFLKKAFEVGSFLVEMNDTLITLIPKQSRPKRMSHLRPISLCNMVVKCTNRLKALVPKLIGEEHSSFVPRRQRLDNIVLVHEMVHSMRIKSGKRGRYYASEIGFRKSI